LKRENNQMLAIIDRMDIQSKQVYLFVNLFIILSFSKKMIPAINWIMTAMDRVKMSAQRPPLIITSKPNN